MEEIVEKLDDINKTLEGIQKILRTPENKVMTVFKYRSRSERTWLFKYC